jgi:curved DNA-binding protein CbpA
MRSIRERGGRSVASVNYYHLLGVSPDATTAEVNEAYLAKVAQLARYARKDRRQDVSVAVQRAVAALDEAKRTLEDVALRSDYDAELRLAGELEEYTTPEHREGWRRRHAEHVWAMERELGLPLTHVFGLHPAARVELKHRDEPPATVSLQHEGLTKPTRYEPFEPLATIADWLAPRPKPSKNTIVPDVSGSHVSEALYDLAKADLLFRFEQVSREPHGGEGIVIGQDPPAGASVRRRTTVTLQVVHPVLGSNLDH